MATTRHLSSLANLESTLRRDLAKVKRKIVKAAQKTARTGRKFAQDKAPKAFGPLRQSIHALDTAEGARIIADAPHAAALEVGSRPHWAPIEPLIAWVKLRGMQGLRRSAKGKQWRGISDWIAEHGTATATSVDAPREVAKAIQLAIAKRGTKPTWYMRDSVGEVYQVFDVTVTQLLKNEPLDG